jgi:lauroyl/myristoyl acyltransferase
MSLVERRRLLPWFDVYKYAIGPVCAFLPGRLAYLFAMMYGGFLYRVSPRAREKLKRNLEWFSLGGKNEQERMRVAKDFLKLRCIETLEDLMLLRMPNPLSKLISIQGVGYLADSVSKGKGVVLCGAHYGSFRTVLSYMGAGGFKSTPLMRRPLSAGPGAGPLRRALYWARTYALLHNMKRPNIPVQSGNPAADIGTATLAAKYLKAGEILFVALDATVLPSNRSRALETKFLGKDALFLTGAIDLAKVTSAKVHVILAHRKNDMRHQKVVISPPIPLDGSVADGFRRCLSMIEEAVREDPAQWEMLDLVPEQGTYFPAFASTG